MLDRISVNRIDSFVHTIDLKWSIYLYILIA